VARDTLLIAEATYPEPDALQVARTWTRQVLGMLAVVRRTEELSGLAPISVIRGLGGGVQNAKL